jgi:hypothetical protein
LSKIKSFAAIVLAFAWLSAPAQAETFNFSFQTPSTRSPLVTPEREVFQRRLMVAPFLLATG